MCNYCLANRMERTKKGACGWRKMDPKAKNAHAQNILLLGRFQGPHPFLDLGKKHGPDNTKVFAS